MLSSSLTEEDEMLAARQGWGGMSHHVGLSISPLFLVEHILLFIQTYRVWQGRFHLQNGSEMYNFVDDLPANVWNIHHHVKIL